MSISAFPNSYAAHDPSLAWVPPRESNSLSSHVGSLEQPVSRWLDWQPLRGNSSNGFLALDSQTGNRVHVYLLPHITAGGPQYLALSKQWQLTRNLGPDYALQVLECDFSNSIAKLIVAAPSGLNADQFLSQADETTRLATALQLLWGTHKACTAGLFHGGLHLNQIDFQSSPALRCKLDYTWRFRDPSTLNEESADSLYLVDLEGCVRMVQQIIEPILASNEPESAAQRKSSLSSRRLAALRRLLREPVSRETAEESFDQWCDLLGECVDDSSNPFRNSQPAVEIDSNPTIAVDIAIAANASFSEPPPSADTNSDKTAESSICFVGNGSEPSNGVPECRINSVQSTDANDSTQEVVLTQPHSAIASLERENAPLADPMRPFGKLQPGDRLGRFQLQSVLGRGGMGVVYRGIDSSNGQSVAIKVLQVQGSDSAHAIRRFSKEARILATVQNEFVTRLIDVGVERGHHYLAMEFVDGSTLKDWLRNRQQPLGEVDALRLTSFVTRALIEAHTQQIIHRDLKPENVLLARLDTSVDETNSVVENNSVDETTIEGSNTASDESHFHGWRVKLSDFGIARHIHQSTSMEVTRAGSMLGTPLYMSPEQCKGSEHIGPAADVYALGILLYELLVGETPFRSDDPMKIAAMQCFDPPPDLQKRNRSISDQTARLVATMLAKKPEERFADASQLYREIERILRGEPSDIEAHPKLPEFDPKKLWSKVFEWELRSTPQQLWPYVTDTDRLNRAVGLHSVQYRTEKDPQRGLRKYGSFKLGAIQITWEEHPFEWVEGKKMGVLREFSSGPFKWFMTCTELIPLPSGGTKLVHSVKIEPRNTLGRVVSTIEAGWKGGKALDRVYKRIDEFLQSSPLHRASSDAFEESNKLDRMTSKRLEQRLDAMISGGIDEEIARKFGDFIRNSSPQSIAKIRPLALASQLAIEADLCLDACLVAAKCGLFRLQWDLLCPTCRVPATSEPILSRIQSHTACEACDVEFQSNIGNAIELVFSVHPEIRQPDNAKYCVGGPAHSPHIVSQIRLQPDERVEIQVPLLSGNYLIRTTQSTTSQAFLVRAQGGPTHLELSLSQLGLTQISPSLIAGQVSITLTNDRSQQQTVRIERTIDRDDVVTAATASSLPRFRELFPEQTFSRDNPVASEELTLVAMQINDPEALYRRLGDADAYREIQSHLTRSEEIVVQCRGAVVKSMGEGFLAAFQDSATAVQAAIALLQQQQQPNPSATPHGSSVSKASASNPIAVGVAVHQGSTLISTQNGRLDYFGSTARFVLQLSQRALGEVLLSDSVFSDPGTMELVNASGLSSQVRELRLSNESSSMVQHISPNSLSS